MAQLDLKALSDVAQGISKKQDVCLTVLFTHLLQEIGTTFDMKGSVKYFIEKRKHLSPLGYLETHLKVPSDLAAIKELQVSLSKMKPALPCWICSQEQTG